MTAFEIARLALLIIGTAAGLLILRVELHGRRKNMCESCEHLQQKRARDFMKFRYVCKYESGFDKPPEYCARYKERSDEK